MKVKRSQKVTQQKPYLFTDVTQSYDAALVGSNAPLAQLNNINDQHTIRNLFNR